MQLLAHLETKASAAIKEALDLDEPPAALVRATQDPSHGDYQLNGAMALAKKLGRSPRDLAEPIAQALRNLSMIDEAEVAGPGFVNLKLNHDWIADQLQQDLGAPERAGVPTVANPEHIVVDFSSPNIAKQMHVGHLRSTIIGDSISTTLAFVGHNVTRDNHIGDWGTQFGLLIVGMRTWGDTDALARTPIVELERVYKLASDQAKTDEAFAQSARDELQKLQSGDADNTKLWERFVEVSRSALQEVYDKLDVTFDTWLGESAYHDALPGVVEDLLSKGIARQDDGAICIFWDEQESTPKKLKKQKTPFIVRKKDGAYLYATTDIATVRYRHDSLNADRALYVVDSRQGLHFEQLFTTMALLGVGIELEHIGFGTVLGNDGKPLRTRDASGQMVTLLSLLDEAVVRAKERVEQGVSEGKLRVHADQVDHVAAIVGIGAVKYADLRQNRLSDYQFDWDKMISFTGNAGPYLQYAYARCQSIFSKGGVDSATINAQVGLSDPQEVALAKTLLRFGDAVHKAAATYQPHLICDHLYDVARAFSAFYNACPVLDADEATRNSRLCLVALTARQLKLGLSLIGIGVVDQM